MKLELTAKEMQNWLGIYTNEVIMKVMARFEEIQNDEFAVRMIKELYKRTIVEQEDEFYTFEKLMSKDGYESYSQFNIHNHSLEHSDSYRDVLYDMYIRSIKIK